MNRRRSRIVAYPLLLVGVVCMIFAMVMSFTIVKPLFIYGLGITGLAFLIVVVTSIYDELRYRKQR